MFTIPESIQPNIIQILLQIFFCYYFHKKIKVLLSKKSREIKYNFSFFIFFAGSRILGVTVPKEQMYPLKLKGISICFSMLKAALCGSYVNFGVFRLYGDDALDNALNSFVKLLLSIPQSDLLVSLQCIKVPRPIITLENK